MSAPERPTRPCPICGKPAVAELRPFCSRRCADVDLNRWLSDGYVLPGLRDDADDADEAPASSGQRGGETL